MKNKYHEFINEGLAVGFTDDQMDFLEEWILNSEPSKPSEEVVFKPSSAMDAFIETIIRADERAKILDRFYNLGFYENTDWGRVYSEKDIENLLK